MAHLPLDETHLGLATALSDEALILLQAAADGAGRDAQVAVVAVDSMLALGRVIARRRGRVWRA